GASPRSPRGRQARLQRYLASQQYGELGSANSSGASAGGATRTGPQLSGPGSAGARPRFDRLGSRRARCGGGRRDSLPAVGGGEKEGEPGTLDGSRSRDQVLPA